MREFSENELRKIDRWEYVFPLSALGWVTYQGALIILPESDEEIFVSGASFGLAGPAYGTGKAGYKAVRYLNYVKNKIFGSLRRNRAIPKPTRVSGNPTRPSDTRGAFNARNLSRDNLQNCSESVVNWERSARRGKRVREPIPEGNKATNIDVHERRLRSVGANPQRVSPAFTKRDALTEHLQRRFKTGQRFSILAERGGGEVGHVFAAQIDSKGLVNYFETQVQSQGIHWDAYVRFTIIVHNPK